MPAARPIPRLCPSTLTFAASSAATASTRASRFTPGPVQSTGRAGFLEEVLFHEGAHVSIDGLVQNTVGWREAQQADGAFISDYARNNPDREDVAESILPYFAVRFRPERLRPGRQRQAIDEAIPARLEYFDAQGFDWAPYMPAVAALPAAAIALLAAILITISGRRR